MRGSDGAETVHGIADCLLNSHVAVYGHQGHLFAKQESFGKVVLFVVNVRHSSRNYTRFHYVRRHKIRSSCSQETLISRSFPPTRKKHVYGGDDSRNKKIGMVYGSVFIGKFRNSSTKAESWDKLFSDWNEARSGTRSCGIR